MMYFKKVVILSSLLLLLPMLASCIKDSQSSVKESAPQASPAVEQTSQTSVSKPQPTLPVRYQTPSYVVDKKPEKDPAVVEESRMKVEARISSTRGPQPLWDILKRLAALKGMNVSWASDVDKDVLVDVNINATDDFFGAIDNLLRQVDYFHEVQGSTIIVKHKETRQFHISMPFSKQVFSTGVGGNVLGAGGTSGGSNVEGTIELKSKENEFDFWENIKLNLDTILEIWTYRREGETVEKDTKKTGETEGARSYAAAGRGERTEKDAESTDDKQQKSSKDVAAGRGYYIIDKPVGLITVTAPRQLMEKIDAYIATLKKNIYRQVAIEAKLLEVHLEDSSSIGLNWNTILTNLSMAGASLSGAKTYSKNETDSTNSSNSLSGIRTTTNSSENVREDISTRNQVFDNLAGVPLTGDTGTRDRTDTSTLTGIVSDVVEATALSGASTATIISNGLTGALGGTISLAAFTFDSFLNAVSKQGKATILSNPKLSVLNGQPALLTVGKNVTYIEKIEVNVSDSGVITYSAETARALSGVGLALTANIVDDTQIILNLVPVTSELSEPIEYRAIGLGSVGLPVINVREMSTTVKVKNGEMLVIGGLISSVDENEGTFLPGTSNLSFFKYLFGAETKGKRKRELIILLKPQII